MDFLISFNPGETFLFNVGIDVFCILVLLIVLFICKSDLSASLEKQLLLRVQRLMLLTLCMDIATWSLNGVPGLAARVFGLAANVIYLLLQLAVLFFFVRFAHLRIYRRDFSRRPALLLLDVPGGLAALLVLTTPLTGLCFSLDAGNVYRRGPLSAPLSAVTLLGMLLLSAAALRQRSRETLSDRRRECLIFSVFGIPPLLGGAAQTVFYGLSLLWPCATLSALLLFLNLESQSISQDDLTRLNNRRNLDRYLHSCLDSRRTVTLLMLDINSFKRFNDRYGHATGDRVLLQTASLLRSAFQGSPAFLSRYGGDEFVVVLPDQDAEEAPRAVETLVWCIAAFNQATPLPEPLSVSIGSATRTLRAPADIAALLREADLQMYREKARYHRAEGAPG